MDKQFRFDTPQVVARADLARVHSITVESDGGLAVVFVVGDSSAFERAERKTVKFAADRVSGTTRSALRDLLSACHGLLVTDGHLPTGAEEDVPPPPVVEAVVTDVEGGAR
jgi:hypothetical protein